MDALTLLLERRSCAALEVPGPDGEELDLILRAALRVPDFQRPHPCEFILARGDGLDRLGALLERAAVGSGQPPEVVARAPRMPHRAPLVVTVAARHRPSAIVRPFEQRLSAGCTVMAMLLAAQALGFGGLWRSGWPMFDRGLHAALGLGEDDQIVGFLYLGTPRQPPDAPPAADPARHVRWL